MSVNILNKEEIFNIAKCLGTDKGRAEKLAQNIYCKNVEAWNARYNENTSIFLDFTGFNASSSNFCKLEKNISSLKYNTECEALHTFLDKSLVLMSAKIKTAEDAAAELKNIMRETNRLESLKTWEEYGLKTSNNVQQNIRIELKKEFPHLKASVRKRHHSTIDVLVWNTSEEESDKIKDIISKYEAGHFNGMTDSYDHEYTPFSENFQTASYIFTEYGYTFGDMVTANIKKLAGVELDKVEEVLATMPDGSFKDEMRRQAEGQAYRQRYAFYPEHAPIFYALNKKAVK